MGSDVNFIRCLKNKTKGQIKGINKPQKLLTYSNVGKDHEADVKVNSTCK